MTACHTSWAHIITRHFAGRCCRRSLKSRWLCRRRPGKCCNKYGRRRVSMGRCQHEICYPWPRILPSAHHYAYHYCKFPTDAILHADFDAATIRKSKMPTGEAGELGTRRAISRSLATAAVRRARRRRKQMPTAGAFSRRA